MAQDIVNGNQNLSYTNLDFSSIYTEVLDMVKQLTKNWDPSISDESDPGVVLVKLSALLADKMNYNIDKSILEAFPLSVTQDSNARQLYEQLGYYMNWYRAATAPITLSWKTKTVDDNGTVLSYTIPKFTTITDENETVVYSLVGVQGDKEVVVSDGLLYTDSGMNLNMIAYEGIPVQYTFNDRIVITPNMVDNNNRLYLSTAYAFENGVFIKNTNQDNYAEWHRVNNLYEYSYNIHRYKFGYDSAANLCYLEFPDNYAELFGSGIEITYLTFSTDENYSDVPAQFLSRFLTNLTVENGSVVLNSEKVKISNTAAAYGHADKEDINSAYTNYKKVVGTFKTLITLRDYLNFIRSKELDLCSNAIVTDRTNDVQSSYKIVNKYRGVDSVVTEVEQDYTDVKFVKTTDEDIQSTKVYYVFNTQGSFVPVQVPDVRDISSYYELQTKDILSPFDLKFYLLQKSIALTSRAAYDNSFNLLSDDIDIETLLEDTSHLVHTFKDIEPLGYGTYEVTSDTSISTDDNGNINKVYYRYDASLHRCIPVVVTNLLYQTYNPAEMGLYTNDTYFKRTSDVKWMPSATYYYRNFRGEYALFPNEEKEKYKYQQPNSVVYIFQADGKTYNSYIYVQVTEYVRTTDTTIEMVERYNTETQQAELVPKTYYNLKDDGTYEEAILPQQGDDSVNPAALGLYEQKKEPLLPHIVFFKNKYPISMSISTYNIVSRNVQEDIRSNIIHAFYQNLDSSNIEFGDNISLDYLTQIVKDADARVKNVAFEALTYTTYAIYWDEYQQLFKEIKLPATASDVNMGRIYTRPTFDNVTAQLFGKDVICKSILAGVTQLLIPDDTFAYHLNQKFIGQYQDVKYITGEAVINMNIQDPYYIISDSSNPHVRRSYTLKENETLTLYRPLLTEVESYTSGVHYEYRIYSDITAGQSYQLQKGEHFIFYISNLDSEGLLRSFTVYVYGENAIINPSFSISARDSLTQYGELATTLVIPSEISSDTKLYTYTESRVAQVGMINNDSTITNTKIGTNETISAQTMNNLTINDDEGYRFIWSLNDVNTNGNLKQYKLFDSYNPEEDINLTNLTTANTYTLKNGEYIYYTDSSLSNLGILGAGTTVTRNCGVNAPVTPLTSLYPYVFVNWHDLQNNTDSSINASGFNIIVDISAGIQQMNPKANGFYEYVDYAYVRSNDTVEDTSKDYYVLLMKDVSGWYVNQSGEYVVSASPTTSIFSPIDVKSEFKTQDISPVEQGFYEKIEYQGTPLTDTYYLPSKDCTDSDMYITNQAIAYSSTVNRYSSVSQDDNTILTSKFLTNVDGNTIDTASPFGNILINTDSLNSYDPFSNDWVLKGGVDGKQLTHAVFGDGLFEQLSDTTDTMPQGSYYRLGSQDVLWKYLVEAHNPYLEMPSSGGEVDNYGLYGSVNSLTNIYIDNKSKLVGQLLIDAVNADWKNNHVLNSQQVSDWQLDSFNASNTTITWPSIDNGMYVQLQPDDIIAATGSLSEQAKRILKSNLCLGFINEATETPSVGLFMYINDLTKALNFGKLQPNAANIVQYSMATNGRKPIGYTAFDVVIRAYKNKSTSSEGIEISAYSNANIINDVGQKYFTEYPYIVIGQSGQIEEGVTLSTVTYSLNNHCVYSYRDTMDALTSWFNILYTAFHTLDDGSYTTGIYFKPLWYRMRNWYAYTNKQYYKLNEYGTKIYTHVDSWVCPAIDSLELTSNPLTVMRTLFQSVQPDTSLSINQTQLYTLSQGDIISVESEDYISPNLELPIFSNEEVTLDLDKYSVMYKRVGNEIATLDKLHVNNCNWQAYSNLQLNTNNSNGQRLDSNQSLTLYNDSRTPITTITGLSDSNIHFQLQYPMTNLTGTFIQVSTSSLTQENILNCLYVYNISPDSVDYSFVSDDHNTYVYCKKADTLANYTYNPSGINIENIRLNAGDYLIPVNGMADIRIMLTYNDNVPHFELTYSSDTLENNLGFDGSVFMNKLNYEWGEYTVQYNSQNEHWELVHGSTTTVITNLLDYGLNPMQGYEPQSGDKLDIIAANSTVSQILTSYTDTIYDTETGQYVPKDYFLGDKLHFAYLHLDSVNTSYTGTLNVKIQNPDGSDLTPDSDTSITVVLGDIFKFSPNFGSAFEEIKEKVRALDINNKYNYTHVPNSNDIITDPLQPKEFWNKNHVYNPFTIAQLDIDNIETKFIT